MSKPLPRPLRAKRRDLGPAAACLLTTMCIIPALACGSLTTVKELNAGKARAEAQLLADKIDCDKLAGNPRDICRERARGKEFVAKAELELAHSGTRKAQDRVTAVKLDTAYDVARTQCNDKTGDAKNVCTKEAQAARARGQARLKAAQRVADARQGAAEDRRDAGHQTATDKCDAMAADARVGCLAAIKAGPGEP